jgi:ABC-type uncharacterized transport system, permease component
MALFKALRKFLVLVEVYYQYMIEYRLEILFWMLSGILPFILMGIWIKLADMGFTGMSGVDFARYFLGVFITQELVSVWVIWEFEQGVLTGYLSHLLLKPQDPIWYYVGAHVSERLAKLPFIFALVIVFFALYPSAFWIPNFFDALTYLLLVSVVFILRFMIQYTVSFFAFWTERISQVEGIIFSVYMFLSGYFAPLDMFPQWARDLAYLTPFPYMIYLPVNVLLGKGLDVKGVLILLTWTLVFALINRVFWKFSLRKYSAMGA